MDELNEQIEKLEDLKYQAEARLEEDPDNIDIKIEIEQYEEELESLEKQRDEREAKEYEAEMREMDRYWYNSRL